MSDIWDGRYLKSISTSDLEYPSSSGLHRTSLPPNTMDNGTTENGVLVSPHVNRPITVAIDPIALVITECITVTSAMRKHARWAHSSVAAILGGATRQAPSDRKSNHARVMSSESINQDEDGFLAGRWGLRGKKGASMQDNPLLSAFARLRSDLKSCKGTTRYWSIERKMLTTS